MNIDELTLGNLKKLKGLLNGSECKKVNYVEDGEPVIVVLQRGWVDVGYFSQEGPICTLNNAFNIRNWGTSKGLGEIAENGPTDSTKLDSCRISKFHELTVVQVIPCDKNKWKDVLR